MGHVVLMDMDIVIFLLGFTQNCLPNIRYNSVQAAPSLIGQKFHIIKPPPCALELNTRNKRLRRIGSTQETAAPLLQQQGECPARSAKLCMFSQFLLLAPFQKCLVGGDLFCSIPSTQGHVYKITMDNLGNVVNLGGCCDLGSTWSFADTWAVFQF